MLDLVTDHGGRDCAGLTRRSFLRVGALGLGGLTLPSLLASERAGFVKGKSVVLLFLAGGASHIETFDPHMDAPEGVRSVTGEVKTSIPGVTFGGTFPKLARLAHRMAVVRSFRHSVGDHAKAIQHVLTAGDPDKISMGSLYTRLRGAIHPKTGLPSYVLLTNEEVDGQYRKEKKRVQVGSAPAAMGPAFAPFDPSGGKSMLKSMELGIPRRRLDDRESLLASLDQLKRSVDSSGAMEAMDDYHQRAVEIILRGAGDAFDLKKEDPRVVERYDTSKYRVGKKKFRDSMLGRQMLMARRLCEAGCGFVTVQSAGWDMHADGNNPGMVSGMEMLGRPLDQAVSAFLEDVHERGLSEKILLVITGDFGRTPKLNKRGGRDHWANLGTLAFAGGGLKMGQVVGSSSRKADVPASTPITPSNLLGTIMHTMFDMGELRVARGVPPEVLTKVSGARPIGELV